jgi:hypothetical protein
MKVNIVAEWVKDDNSRYAKTLEVMVLKSGDNVLARVRKKNMY